MILPTQPGAHLAAVRSAMPENRVDREQTVEALARLFPRAPREWIASLVERSGVETRHIVPSIDEVLGPASFTARNQRYREAAARLAATACLEALRAAGLEPAEVDVVIDVSCTGIAIPALDVDLAARLGLRPDARRIPITESGCAAGGLALGLAASLAQAGQRVLVIAVELCSLTLCRGDLTRTNLVASVLFGDGAAAAVVVPGGAGPRLEAVGSHLIPGTSGVMGFDVGDHGLRIVLQRELPLVLREELPRAVERFLRSHGRDLDDLALHLVHPGGRRILEAYGEVFGLDGEALRFSRESLRRYGNLSSASILTVLELALADRVRLPPDKEALLVAVGPGLSLKMALLRWECPG